MTGTVRNKDKVQSLLEQHPETFDCRILDVTDLPEVQGMVHDFFKKYEKIDVIVSNAGYGLFGFADFLLL